MKTLLRRALGADRPKIIAVFASNRADAEQGVKHAHTSGATLPVWVWCAENAAPVAGCDRVIRGNFAAGLGQVWPALSIVSWTGSRGATGLKVAAFLRPPFRIVVFNEAGGFFAPRPLSVSKHVGRRLRDRTIGFARRASDLLLGSIEWTGAALQWIAARVRDAAQWVFWKLFHAALWTVRLIPRTFWAVWPALVWLAERSGDAVQLAWSLAWRAGQRVRDWAFILLAACATPLTPLSRSIVAGVRKKQGRPLVLEDVPVVAREVILPNRGWSRGAVLDALQCDAEFVVLRRIGEKTDASPLIALARETDAFAVARQIAWSSWRRTVVAKHPFRRLQPGEVAELFAPFSSLIVIRRSALLKLGVPRALTGGCALMLLFWKASAAGLRTLVAGHEDPITDEPAMALEDTEFAFRLSWSKELKHLKPARPSRYRGNLAWSPFHRRDAETSRPRVLVVSPYLPFPLSHGGAVRIYNLCRALKDRVDFTLACFHEAGEKICYPELHEVFREIFVVDIDEKRNDRSVPKQVAEYRNPAMSDLIRQLCSGRDIDLVQLEYTQMAEYRNFTGSTPVVLVEHDITFSLYKQLADFRKDAATRSEYDLWHDFEREALQCSNAVWTMSEDECALALAHHAPRHSTAVIPNGVDVRRFLPSPKPNGPPTILFVGSFRHLPNLLAYESLRTVIMPEVWRECPEAILHVIAGPHHEKAAEDAGRKALLAAHPNIRIDGFVSDVRPAYEACDVVAVPLPLSAGTNIKLLEAMACGRAIVSTQSGCRGLNLTNGHELIVAELDASFAHAIVTLLRDETLRGRMAHEARAVAEQRFSWDAIADDAFASYMRVTANPASSEQPAVRSVYARPPQHP